MLQAIRVCGQSLAELAIEHGLGDKLRWAYPHGNICALCDDLLSNPEMVAFLEERLQDPEIAGEIQLTRLVRYGELPMVDAAKGG